MKKLILLGALSVLFYSAPGYATKDAGTQTPSDQKIAQYEQARKVYALAEKEFNKKMTIWKQEIAQYAKTEDVGACLNPSLSRAPARPPACQKLRQKFTIWERANRTFMQASAKWDQAEKEYRQAAKKSG